MVRLSQQYFVNLEGKDFIFVDVPPDGNCFYHSLLRCSRMSCRFQTVSEIRYYLRASVLMGIGSDRLLLKIFEYYRIDYNQWINHIIVMNTWATPLDMLLCSYMLKTNIISVGNYGGGILQNNTRSSLTSILRRYCTNINMDHTVYMYFHNYGSPLEKITNGNHFGFLAKIANNKLLHNGIFGMKSDIQDTTDYDNSMAAMSNIHMQIPSNTSVTSRSDRNEIVNINDSKSSDDCTNLYQCYIDARSYGLSIIDGTYKLWSERYPDKAKSVTKHQLYRKLTWMRKKKGISMITGLKNSGLTKSSVCDEPDLISEVNKNNAAKTKQLNVDMDVNTNQQLVPDNKKRQNSAVSGIKNSRKKQRSNPSHEIVGNESITGIAQTEELPTNICTTNVQHNGLTVVPSLCETIQREQPLSKTLEILNRTKRSNSNHHACVCVVCDSFIIGTEPICWLSTEQLLEKTSVLSVSYLESSA